MSQYLLQRLFLNVPVIILVISIVFLMGRARPDSLPDDGLRVFAVLGLAIPSFYLGTLLLLFSVKVLGWTPPLVNTAYREIWDDPIANLKMMALPALAGGLGEAAIIMRLLRSQLLEVLRQDYVRTAFAKGLKERNVVMTHALRNALIPVVTILGLLIGAVVGAD